MVRMQVCIIPLSALRILFHARTFENVQRYSMRVRFSPYSVHLSSELLVIILAFQFLATRLLPPITWIFLLSFVFHNEVIFDLD